VQVASEPAVVVVDAQRDDVLLAMLFAAQVRFLPPPGLPYRWLKIQGGQGAR
jgi:hypothetical protein